VSEIFLVILRFLANEMEFSDIFCTVLKLPDFFRIEFLPILVRHLY